MKLKFAVIAMLTVLAFPVQAGPVEDLLNIFKPSADAQKAAADSAGLGSLQSVDFSNIVTVPMTAEQLFAKQGMQATLDLAQNLATAAKTGDSGVVAGLFGSLFGDTGAMLRLASRMTASYLSYTALRELMVSISGDEKVMKTVTVNVPQVGDKNPQLQADIEAVARFLVAMKASNLLVTQGEKSLESAKERYKKLMVERDEKARSLGKANMFVGGVLALDDGVLKSLSGEDLGYLKNFGGKPIDEVLKDSQAAQIIDSELRRKYPTEYTSIIAAEKEVASHYGEYAKTTVGTLSMIGFAAIFINNVMDLSKRSLGHKIVLVPMAKDAGGEMVDLVKSVIASIGKNDELVEGTFSITAEGKTTSGIAASKVLKSLSQQQLDGFRNATIGASPSSYLSQLDRRSSDFAADILDRLVDRDTKAEFAKAGFSVENPDTFSFKAAFSSDTKGNGFKPTDPRLKRKLYEEDFGKEAEGKEQVYAKLQTKIKTDVTGLSNQDLRRIMMLHSKESIEIGGVLVRMEQPGLQGLADRLAMNQIAALSAIQDTGAKTNAESVAGAAKPGAAKTGKGKQGKGAASKDSKPRANQPTASKPANK